MQEPAITEDIVVFVQAALPDAPASVLEVGAGAGELTAQLTAAGYAVTAVDPAPGAPHVIETSLHEVEGPAGSYDAAVAVLSLHHVEPLMESLQNLARLVRPGGVVVVDEFDVERFDERAARWMLAQWAAIAHEPPYDGAQAMVDELQGHLHSFRRISHEMSSQFRVSPPVRGAYLHHWVGEPGLRATEESLIARGKLPATGARVIATRR
jgi:SAM-dependent methyltransferase